MVCLDNFRTLSVCQMMNKVENHCSIVNNYYKASLVQLRHLLQKIRWVRSAFNQGALLEFCQHIMHLLWPSGRKFGVRVMN